MQMDFMASMQAEERRHSRISAIVTTVLVVGLLLLSFVWTAYRYRTPPIGTKEYEMLGSIDFGDYKQGSRNINNFERSRADATEATPPPAEAEPTPPTPAENTPPPPVVTTPEPAPEIVTPTPKPSQPTQETTPAPHPPASGTR